MFTLSHHWARLRRAWRHPPALQGGSNQGLEIQPFLGWQRRIRLSLQDQTEDLPGSGLSYLRWLVNRSDPRTLASLALEPFLTLEPLEQSWWRVPREAFAARHSAHPPIQLLTFLALQLLTFLTGVDFSRASSTLGYRLPAGARS